jgi:hypothetical protein
MNVSRNWPLILAILTILVGVFWVYATVQHAYGDRGPGGLAWVWAVALGVIGILTFAVSGGPDKLSIVFGPFFLTASLLAILRMLGAVRADLEIPIIVMVVGILLLASQWPGIPYPRRFVPLTPPPPDADYGAND